MSSVPKLLPGGRLAYERAIRYSSLPAPARHLALTIATWADIGTGVIPDRFQPSLSTLEEATGLSRKTVRTHLDTLEEQGWLIRDRPDPEKARTEHAQTRYALLIPAGARGADPLGLGAEVPQPRGARTPGKGHTSPRARGGDPPKSPSQSHESPLSSDDDDEPAAAPEAEEEEREKPSAGDGSADAVVAAYVEALHRPVSSSIRSKLRQQAVDLLADGFPPGWLADRARELAERGWTDLAQHCSRSTVPTEQVRTDSRADWCGHCSDPNHRMIKDPARDNELVPCDACHPAAVARRRRAQTGETAA